MNAVGVTHLGSLCSTRVTAVLDVVLIPPFYVILPSSVFCCVCNTIFNCISSRPTSITWRFEGWGRILSSRATFSQAYARMDAKNRNSAEYTESDKLLSTDSSHSDPAYNTFLRKKLSDEELDVESPDLQASVLNTVLLDSLQSARLEAQRVVFVYNRKYMIIATAKSLAMLVVLQYHYDNKGGWDRLVVCSAANVMSGLLTPILEYAAGLLLPLDGDLETKNTTVDQEESSDSVLIVEVLTRVGRLQLDDLETVLIQGSTFIVFGAVFLPAVVVFCLAGFAFFFWMFMPCWILYVVLRRNYYRHSGTGRGASAGGVMSAFSTPVGELGKATLLKIMTLFLLQWTVQCSFLFGLVLMEGGSYREALRLEARHQFFGWYNPLEMTRFQWLCFASQIFF